MIDLRITMKHGHAPISAGPIFQSVPASRQGFRYLIGADMSNSNRQPGQENDAKESCTKEHLRWGDEFDKMMLFFSLVFRVSISCAHGSLSHS